MRPLEGRTAAVNGANQCLGLAIARAYVEAGASVMMCARDAARLDQVRGEATALATEPGQCVLARPADVTRPDEGESLVHATLDAFPVLDVLVNNAVVYGPLGIIEYVDWEAWVRADEITLFGSILMCRAVFPYFKSRHAGKIVQLFGGGATNPLPGISAYSASKAAIVRLMEALAGEVRGHGIDVNSIAPGSLNTRVLDEVIEAGPGRVGKAFYEKALKQKQQGGTPVEKCAALVVFLGSTASDGITGKLLSASWETLPEHREDLTSTGVYTLRRIVPADRGLPWGT